MSFWARMCTANGPYGHLPKWEQSSVNHWTVNQWISFCFYGIERDIKVNTGTEYKRNNLKQEKPSLFMHFTRKLSCHPSLYGWKNMDACGKSDSGKLNGMNAETLSKAKPILQMTPTLNRPDRLQIDEHPLIQPRLTWGQLVPLAEMTQTLECM